MSTAATTIVRPTDQTLSAALRLALIFAAIKLALHIVANMWQAHIGYGYFRDELYYLICGRHLAWGYVDHGPLVALQARLGELIFGDSLVGIRMFSAIAGALRILLTGLLAWSLGGRRPAQSLAMICVLVAPQYLGTDSYLSMNSFESAFWMRALMLLILIQRGWGDRLWLIFGLLAGFGLLNKPSMTFFLVALLLALLCTPQRRLLFNRWAAAGIAPDDPYRPAQPHLADSQPLAHPRVSPQRRDREQEHQAPPTTLPRPNRYSTSSPQQCSSGEPASYGFYETRKPNPGAGSASPTFSSWQS